MAKPFDKDSAQDTAMHGASSTLKRQHRKQQAARVAILSNTLFVLLKLGVGFWSGSVGVLSEALHSATDLLASGIAYFSVRASDSPPDEEHPYGHGKIESLSGLAESALIFAAAGFIIRDATRQLAHPAHSHVSGVNAGIALMACSAVANLLVSGHLRRVAALTDSPALGAEASHLRTDVTTSVGVFVGLALARWTGVAWFDPVTALGVAVVILHTAYRIAKEALSPLLDARLPYQEEAAIQEVLELDDRVLGYHKLRTRKSGSQRHADVHVQIDDNCTLVQAHDLTEELEDQIREILPAIHINIHIEPYHAEIRHQQEVHGVKLAPPASLSSREDSRHDSSCLHAGGNTPPVVPGEREASAPRPSKRTERV